jgi:proton-coupled amino acid transporter
MPEYRPINTSAEDVSPLIVSSDGSAAFYPVTPAGSVDNDVPLQSTPRAFFNALKAFIASGLLGLPYSFSLAGMWLSLGSLIPVAFVSCHCMLMLVKTKYMMQKALPMGSAPISTYTEMMTISFGRVGRILADTSLISSQLGFCTVYIIFLATNLNRLAPEVSKIFFILIVFPVVYALSLLRSMKVLGPFSGLSNFCVILGAIMVMVYSVPKIGEGKGVEGAVWPTYPVYLSGLIYAFEGIGCVLPIENAMKNRKHFGPVMIFVTVLLVVIFAVFGAIGYSAYGSDVQAVITLELPQNGFTICVLVLLMIAILFTYPLMAFPAIEIIELKVFNVDSLYMRTARTEMLRNLLRFCIVCLTAGLAMAIPNFGLVLAFVGAFTCIPLMFIFPPLMHWRTGRSYLSKRTIIIDWAIVVIGIIAFIVASVETIIDTVEYLKG